MKDDEQILGWIEIKNFLGIYNEKQWWIKLLLVIKEKLSKNLDLNLWWIPSFIFFTKIEECMIIKVVIHQKIYRYTLLQFYQQIYPIY